MVHAGIPRIHIHLQVPTHVYWSHDAGHHVYHSVSNTKKKEIMSCWNIQFYSTASISWNAINLGALHVAQYTCIILLKSPTHPIFMFRSTNNASSPSAVPSVSIHCQIYKKEISLQNHDTMLINLQWQSIDEFTIFACKGCHTWMLMQWLSVIIATLKLLKTDNVVIYMYLPWIFLLFHLQFQLFSRNALWYP